MGPPGPSASFNIDQALRCLRFCRTWGPTMRKTPSGPRGFTRFFGLPTTPKKVGSLPFVACLDRPPTEEQVVEVHTTSKSPCLPQSSLRMSLFGAFKCKCHTSGRDLPTGEAWESEEDCCSLTLTDREAVEQPHHGHQSLPSAAPAPRPLCHRSHVDVILYDS